MSVRNVEHRMVDRLITVSLQSLSSAPSPERLVRSMSSPYRVGSLFIKISELVDIFIRLEDPRVGKELNNPSSSAFGLHTVHPHLFPASGERYLSFGTVPSHFNPTREL